MEKELNFSEIANIINKDYERHENNIKKFCIKSSIISSSKFYEGYENEVKNINSEITPSKDNPSIADFGDLFKVFDEYPANLQKPVVKKPQTKETPRVNALKQKSNSSLDVSNSSTASNTTQQKDSTIDAVENTSFEDAPTASETFSNFKNFQQNQKAFMALLQDEATTTEYKRKLKQLHCFALQLKKLTPNKSKKTPAFTPAEEEKLRQLAKNVEELKFIEGNADIFRSAPEETNWQLQNLNEVMTYLLLELSPYIH